MAVGVSSQRTFDSPAQLSACLLESPLETVMGGTANLLAMAGIPVPSWWTSNLCGVQVSPHATVVTLTLVNEKLLKSSQRSGD